VATEASRFITAFLDGVPVARVRVGPASWTPPVDVWETEQEVVVAADVAGIDERHLEVRFEGRELVIRGQRPDPGERADAERLKQHQMELTYGRFERTIALPVPVDGDHIVASYKNGLLTIACPKVGRPGSLRVAVTRADAS